MPDASDWNRTTFGGNRKRQHEAFRALPLREKIARIEQMEEVIEHFATRRRGTPPRTLDAHTDRSAGDGSDAKGGRA